MTIAVPYFVTHFLNVLESVEQHYGESLSALEQSYLTQVRSLPACSLNLYVRLINRKGPFYRQDKLQYQECEPIAHAIEQLINERLVIYCTAETAIANPTAFWRCFSQKELVEHFTPDRCATKATLCQRLESTITNPHQQLLNHHAMVMLSKEDHWRFLKFMYFGELIDNLSGFVVQELGHVVTEYKTASDLKPHFASRDEAYACYHLANLYENFKKLRDHMSATEILHWRQSQSLQRIDLPCKAWPYYDKLVDRLGRLLERNKNFDAAAALYAVNPSVSREHNARLLAKQNHKDRAITLCNDILTNPSHQEEAYSARQLLNRLEGNAKTSHARIFMDSALRITLPYQSSLSVEMSVLKHYHAQGWQGIYSENWLWNALFGLLLWDIIYDSRYGSFHHSLQMAPSDLYLKSFYQNRCQAIENRLMLLHRNNACFAVLDAVYEAKYGIMNPFIGWYEDTLPMIKELLTHVPAEALICIVRHMAMDVKRHCKGFPDLFLWREGEHLLLEVKSPNDQLAAHQYNWLQFMSECGVTSQALKVTYEQALCNV